MMACWRVVLCFICAAVKTTDLSAWPVELQWLLNGLDQAPTSEFWMCSRPSPSPSSVYRSP
jgi:hypothetical protein